jgi:hypothetical protein
LKIALARSFSWIVHRLRRLDHNALIRRRRAHVPDMTSKGAQNVLFEFLVSAERVGDYVALFGGLNARSTQLAHSEL